MVSTEIRFQNLNFFIDKYESSVKTAKVLPGVNSGFFQKTAETQPPTISHANSVSHDILTLNFLNNLQTSLPYFLDSIPRGKHVRVSLALC